MLSAQLTNSIYKTNLCFVHFFFFLHQSTSQFSRSLVAACRFVCVCVAFFFFAFSLCCVVSSRDDQRNNLYIFGWLTLYANFGLKPKPTQKVRQMQLPIYWSSSEWNYNGPWLWTERFCPITTTTTTTNIFGSCFCAHILELIMKLYFFPWVYFVE